MSLLFLFSACGEQAVYEEALDFEDGNWKYEDELILEFNVEDIVTKYNLDLFLTHNTDYAYQNVYFDIETNFPDGKKLNKTLPVDLANKFGKWHGKCSGEKCKLRVFLQQSFKFRESGKHKIVIRQQSRESSLEGIESVNLSLFKAE